MRDAAVGFRVVFDIGIQQEKRHPAYLHPPYLGVQGPARQGNLERPPLPVFVPDRQERQLGEALRRVNGFLFAASVQLLFKIAVAVQQAHAHHVHILVAGFLEVVPGQDAQTARIDLEAFVQAVFHAEIGYFRAGFLFGLFHIGLEILIYLVQLGQEDFVVLQLLEPQGAEVP